MSQDCPRCSVFARIYEFAMDTLPAGPAKPAQPAADNRGEFRVVIKYPR
jgi:hypothetical protein